MSRTSNGSREIGLIQHTTKRDKGPQITPSLKQIQPVEPEHLDLDRDSCPGQIVVFERVQFKNSTANNGKRRAAQQYHVLYCELYAR